MTALFGALLSQIITIGDADRFLEDRVYRNRCVDRILEIVLDIEIWMGVGRLFVP